MPKHDFYYVNYQMFIYFPFQIFSSKKYVQKYIYKSLMSWKHFKHTYT